MGFRRRGCGRRRVVHGEALMPRPTDINPKTGKRFNFIDPEHKDPDVSFLSNQAVMLKRNLKAVEARDKLMSFIKYTSPDPEAPNDPDRSRYKNARHHDAIARVIEEVEKGKIKFLVLTTAPRHGKSEIVSRRLPAWYAGRHPRENVVVATYSDEFASDFGADVRWIMHSPSYKQIFPDVKLMRGGTAKDRLQTTQGGLLFFVGRGGALTGRGAHLLVIDDLIKDDKEASSQAIRDQAWNWLTRVALTRRQGRKLVIMTFTRWHSDDPIGRLTDPENPYFNRDLAKEIKIINMPAIAEDSDPLGRQPGEALWPDGPDQFDLDFLKQQQSLDPLGFAALYQGRPSVLDGDLFKRENVRYYDKADLPENLRHYCASDHALEAKERNDPTLLVSASIDAQSNIYIRNCYWRKQPTDRVVEAMLDMAEEHKPLLWWAGRDHITKSIGPFLRKRMAERGTYINIREVPTIGDKVQGAQSIAGRFAMGKVFWPKSEPWVERAVNELLSFPNGLHDEWADVLGLFGRGLQSQIKPGAPAPVKTGEPRFGTISWMKRNDAWNDERKAARAAGGF
jgi:predicted phage terminase large subunit-like protein